MDQGSTGQATGSPPRVLMATVHDWASPLRLGCHHLAEGLVRAGCEVGFISGAVSPIQILRDRRDYADRWRRRKAAGETHWGGRLWAYTPLSLLTPHNAPLLRSGALQRDWHRLTVPNVIRMVREHGFADVDLLYIDSPAQIFWLDRIRSTRSVARIADRLAGFPGISPGVLTLERELIRSVDIVACSAHLIVEDVTALGARRTLHLPNGVDFDHFNLADRARPKDLASITRPIALYVGEMAHWFDFSLINQLTESMPDVSFVFIGPDRMARARLTSRGNVHILGRRPFEVLPAYLWNADVGLIPFDVAGHADLVNAVHPLKLYEYLACELPVVATEWDELSRLRSPAILCSGVSEFESAIRGVLSRPPAPSEGVAFARRADWSGRVRTLLMAAGISLPSL
jgi:glycosyltransferase involved in cell wall biosynthesis